MENNDPDPSLFGRSTLGGTADPYNAQLSNMSYIDLSAIYSVTTAISIRAGVNNVLDKDPPLTVASYLGGAGSANAFPSYDLLGRQAFIGFTARFQESWRRARRQPDTFAAPVSSSGDPIPDLAPPVTQ